MTNGYVKIPKGHERIVREELRELFRERFIQEFGVNPRVKVTLIPIAEVIENVLDRMDFTHAYKVVFRG